MNRILVSTALALTLLASSVAAKELRIAVSTHISNVDIQDTTGNNGAPMMYQAYETLIERNSFSSPVTFKPGLATEWEQIEPTVWEFKLRENVKMHDGTTMDAYDVEYSLDRVFQKTQPEFAAAWGRWFYNYEDVEVVDPMTVRVHTIKEDPLFEVMMSARMAGITSKEHYESMTYEDAAQIGVGTGPYKITEFVARDLAVMERFDDYWGEPAPLDKITFKHVKEVASRVTGLVNGEFDLVTNIPPDQEAAMQQPGIKTMGVTWPMFHVWIIAQNNEPTDDPRVRKALRLCTDRQALIDGLWGGKAHLPLAHQFSEYGEPYYMPELDLIKFDPEQGKALLAEAGYNGETVLAQFPRSYYLYGDLAAQVIQQQWAECGIDLKLEEVDSIDYDIVNVRAWSNPMYYPDPLGAMDTHWSIYSWVGQRNLWTPTHPEWESTYERARFATEVSERKDAYLRLLEISEEESGWLLMYEPHEVYGMVEGLSFDIPLAQRPYVLPLRAGEFSYDE